MTKKTLKFEKRIRKEMNSWQHRQVCSFLNSNSARITFKVAKQPSEYV